MAKQVEETPRFSMAFLGKVAPAGRKVQGSNRPEIKITSTKDKFTLNSKACLLMGVSEGTRVVMIDQNLFISDVDSKLPQNKRFYIAVAPEDYTGVTSLVGKQNAFSYSGVWSAIIMDDPTINEATIPDLVRSGKGILRGEEGKNYVGLKKAVAAITQYVETDDDGNKVELFPLNNEMAEAKVGVKIYSINDITILDHTPKEFGGTDDDAEDQTTETGANVED